MISRIDNEIRFFMKMCYCFAGNADRRDKFFVRFNRYFDMRREYRSLIRKSPNFRTVGSIHDIFSRGEHKPHNQFQSCG
jgi:hypothetical protein